MLVVLAATAVCNGAGVDIGIVIVIGVGVGGVVGVVVCKK